MSVEQHTVAGIAGDVKIFLGGGLAWMERAGLFRVRVARLDLHRQPGIEVG